VKLQEWLESGRKITTNIRNSKEERGSNFLTLLINLAYKKKNNQLISKIIINIDNQD